MLRLIFVNIYICVMFLVMRVAMQDAYITSEQSSLYAKDIASMYELGLAYDVRVSTMASCVCLVLMGAGALCAAMSRRFARGFGAGAECDGAGSIGNSAADIRGSVCASSISNSASNAGAKLSGLCAAVSRLCYALERAWVFVALFVLCGFGFLGFYYYEAYKSRVDVFVFNLAADDTRAALGIIYSQYPVWTMLLACAAYSALGGWIYGWLMQRQSPKTTQSALSAEQTATTAERTATTNEILRVIFYGVLWLGFLGAYVVGMRGGVGTFPLREDDSRISSLAVINDTATNPLLALVWAHKHYKDMDEFYAVDFDALQASALEIFGEPIIATTPTDAYLADHPPHVVFALMESFGVNFLAYDDERHDMLAGLREHFRSDFVFTRFLSAHNGTAPSFAGLYMLSPYAHLSYSTKKHIKLALSPFDVYKRAGYEVVFITSANAAWQNIGEYLRIQGVDRVYDMYDLMREYPASRSMLNAYGVPDEFIYQKALDVLKSAKKPTFIAILTTSNHPPFYIPEHFAPRIQMDDEFSSHLDGKNAAYISSSARVYAYANDSFGAFINSIKSSSLGAHTIIAASGDHHNRDIKPPSADYLAHQYAVPLYMYVPPRYQRDVYYDRFRPGSHKDIFATLYELSLSGAKYINLGGRNMLAKPANDRLEFGINESFYIDSEIVNNTYASFALDDRIDNHDGFDIKNHNDLQPKDGTIIQKRMQKYAKLYKDQLNYRVNGGGATSEISLDGGAGGSAGGGNSDKSSATSEIYQTKKADDENPSY